jgi:hypothetical protein
MTTQEENFKISLCQDCALAVANGDSTGMIEERESEVIEGINLWTDDGFHLAIDHEDVSDFAKNPCDVCRSSLHGYRVGGYAFRTH